MVTILASECADINAESKHTKSTPLHFAAVRGTVEIIETLVIQAKAAIDHLNALRVTPLTYSCAADNEEVMLKLMGLGADAKYSDVENVRKVPTLFPDLGLF